MNKLRNSIILTISASFFMACASGANFNPRIQKWASNFATMVDLTSANERKIDTPEPKSPVVGKVARPDYNQSTGFFTLSGKVYDANGNEFIARGINNMHVWYDTSRGQPAKDALDNIASFGFNSVRIAWDTDYSDHGYFPHDWILEDIIETTINNKMVPMVELHDFTGSNNTSDLLNRGVKWWTARADMWQKYEKYLMINIANEFGDHALAQGSSRVEFPRVYKEAITRIRRAGINNTLIIDPFYWGKDYSLVAEYGREIYEHDPQKNVIFSIHFYAGAGENQSQIHEAFDSITGQGLPMIVGEFGTWRGSSHNIQEDYIMAQAEKYGVGTYPWAWHGNTEGLHEITTHWEASSPNELTPFGQNVIFGDNGVQETSELATIFEHDIKETVNKVPIN